MGQQETMVTRKNRIMIFGPKTDGIYVVEFRTAAGEALLISVPAGETGASWFTREEARDTISALCLAQDYSTFM
jgi:hypothetical protein